MKTLVIDAPYVHILGKKYANGDYRSWASLTPTQYLSKCSSIQVSRGIDVGSKHWRDHNNGKRLQTGTQHVQLIKTKLLCCIAGPVGTADMVGERVDPQFVPHQRRITWTIARGAACRRPYTSGAERIPGHVSSQSVYFD